MIRNGSETSMEIMYKKSAAKYIKTLDKPTQKRMLQAIEQLPKGDIKRLQGYQPITYRLRVGGYRIIFTMDEKQIIIKTVDVRGDIYK